MKKFLLYLLTLIMPSICFAQHYEIKKADITTAGLALSGNKIDMTKANWDNEAYLKFTGFTATELPQIEVHWHDTTEVISATSVTATDETFLLKGAMEQKKHVFDIFLNGNAIGTVSFDLKAADGTVVKEKDDPKENLDDSDPTEGYLGVLASANFVGNNKFLSDLTPVVNMGGVTRLSNTKNFSWQIDVNPYMGAQINTKDSVSLVPALMLYGRAGLTFNNYLNFFFNDKKTQITVMPFGFGLKFIPNLKDSNNLVIQHNIRFGIALKYDNVFTLSGQITRGWHNITSSSEVDFKKVFGDVPTSITYATVTGQFAFKGKTNEISNYVFFEWRGLLSKHNFSAFTNNRILTLGIRKTLDLTGGGAFSVGDDGEPVKSPKKRNRVRMSL